MAIGIVSDSDFELEAEKLGELRSVNKGSEAIPARPTSPDSIPLVKEIERGRGNGNVAVPDSIKSLIGITSIEEGRKEAVAIANALQLSPSSVSAYSHGANSTASYDTPNQTLTNKLLRTKQVIQKKAQRNILRAFEHITEDKLAEAKVRELAGVAQAMSAIVKNLEPSSEGKDNRPNVQFVVFAPKIQAEDNFEVITLSEAQDASNVRF